MHTDSPLPATTELTDREQQILKLLATGTSNKDIAQQLFISSNTVKVHIRNIFAKIGVNSRTEAAVYAIHAGLTAVELPAPESTLPEIAVKTKRGQLYFRISVALMILLTGTITFLVTREQIPRPAVPSPSPVVSVAVERWHAVAALPTARSGLAVAVEEDHIYAIGGETAQGVSGVTEQYDVDTNKWVSLKPLLVPVSDISATVIGGRVYIPGGRLSSGAVTDILESYDPSLDIWERRAPLPVAMSGYALAAYEGKMYLFGGWDGKNYLSSVLEYDPNLDQWSQRKPMPTARDFAGAAIAGGQIYVVGGYNGSAALSVNEAYNPNHDLWSQHAALPAGRYAMGVTSLADIIYTVGGSGEESGSVLQPLQFSYQQDRWQTFEDPPSQSWLHLGLVALQSRLFAIGGKWNGQPAGKTLSYQALYTILVPVIP